MTHPHAGTDGQTRGVAVALLMAMTAASIGIMPTAEAATSCGYDFNDSNAPDGSSCTFSCGQGQILTISIVASDHDATASGGARCGGGWSPCRTNEGSWSCAGEEGLVNEADPSGTCSANVDEWVNSAWGYNCASKNPPPPPDPVGGCQNPPCEPNPNCIVGQVVCCPKAICGSDGGFPPDTLPAAPDPSGAVCFLPRSRTATPGLGTVQPPEVCRSTDTEGSDGSSPNANLADPATGLPAGVNSRVDVWVTGSTATGRLCNAGLGCFEIVPLCVFDLRNGRASCTVPDHPKVLGTAPPFAS